MPCTPWRSTSSATRNASTIEVCLSSTVSRRLLGTTISVSTSSASAFTPCSRLLGAARALEAERLGDDRHRQRPHFARDPRDDRRRAGARAAAGARRDEDHVRALQQRLRAVVVLHRRLARPGRCPSPSPRPRVSSAPMCSVMSAVDCCSDCRSVLIARNSTPAHLGLDHAVDGVDARAADAHHADHRVDHRLPAGLAVASGAGLLARVHVHRRGRALLLAAARGGSRRGVPSGRSITLRRDLRREHVAQALARAGDRSGTRSSSRPALRGSSALASWPRSSRSRGCSLLPALGLVPVSTLGREAPRLRLRARCWPPGLGPPRSC